MAFCKPGTLSGKLLRTLKETPNTIVMHQSQGLKAVTTAFSFSGNDTSKAKKKNIPQLFRYE